MTDPTPAFLSGIESPITWFYYDEFMSGGIMDFIKKEICPMIPATGEEYLIERISETQICLHSDIYSWYKRLHYQNGEVKAIETLETFLEIMKTSLPAQWWRKIKRASDGNIMMTQTWKNRGVSKAQERAREFCQSKYSMIKFPDLFTEDKLSFMYTYKGTEVPYSGC